MIYVVLVILILLYFFTFRQFIKASKKKENIWNYLILPALFLISSSGFSVLMPSKFLVQSLFIVVFLFLNIYFRTTYYYFLKPEKYQKNSLENLSSYGSFLSVYFAASGIYGLQSFLGMNTCLLMLILLFFISAIVYQVFLTNSILTKSGILFIIILPLTYLEIAWSISFLSLSYYILGLIMAVCYYIAIGLVRFYLIGKLDAQIIKLYLIFGFLSIFSVLFTSRWV
ncbi:TPA: hypothetical protein DDY55_01405 [Candidatus Falkowbacteria bacterium]|nr:hypothetical protein [Candidatus Falkowbacteria bacterium]HAY12556.1 hypothetical protein [Candidatus Falkowbacteria bacterium]HBI96762.1 hypothetical protein [Candidatus Falkowbacteria bacterium]